MADTERKMYIVPNELLHSVYDVFDGRLSTKPMTGFFIVRECPPTMRPDGIHGVQLPVKQIDIICLKLSQALSDRLSDKFWIVADLPTPFRSDKISKLGCQEDLFRQSVNRIIMIPRKSNLATLPRPLKPFPQQLLTIAIHRSRIPMSTSKLVGSVEEGEALFIWRLGPVKGWQFTLMNYDLAVVSGWGMTYC